MMPEEAEATVAAAMELTAGRLDHVVAHSAVRYYPTCPTTWGAACPHPHPHPHPQVRWWGRAGECDETGTISAMREGGTGSILHLDQESFAQQMTMLPRMQFESARLLLPRLQAAPNASYTLVTGGAGEDARSPIGQINAQAVWGLAAALRNEMRASNSAVRIGEVRVGVRFNRSIGSEPFSHDLGRICAGLAASAETANALHAVDSQQQLAPIPLHSYLQTTKIQKDRQSFRQK